MADRGDELIFSTEGTSTGLKVTWDYLNSFRWCHHVKILLTMENGEKSHSARMKVTRPKGQ